MRAGPVISMTSRRRQGQARRLGH